MKRLTHLFAAALIVSGLALAPVADSEAWFNMNGPWDNGSGWGGGPNSYGGGPWGGGAPWNSGWGGNRYGGAPWNSGWGGNRYGGPAEMPAAPAEYPAVTPVE